MSKWAQNIQNYPEKTKTSTIFEIAKFAFNNVKMLKITKNSFEIFIIIHKCQKLFSDVKNRSNAIIMLKLKNNSKYQKLLGDVRNIS